MGKHLNKREQQREKSTRAMLDAAMLVFAESGYYATKFSSISKIANVTNGLIVQRFGSKEELFEQIFVEIFATNFPNLSSSLNIKNALEIIIDFIKSIANESKTKIAFGSMALSSLPSLPHKCDVILHKTFVDSGAKQIFENWIKDNKIEHTNEFVVFVGFLKDCFELTDSLLSSNTPLALNEVYLQLFDKWNALDTKNHDAIVFKKIADNTAEFCEATSFYVDFSKDHKPFLYLPNHVLQKMGISEGKTPEYVYNFWIKHVDPKDRLVVKKSVERLLTGERIEFVFSWSSRTVSEVTLRCIGVNLRLIGKETRIEGLFQNVKSFTHIQNHHQIRNFLISSIAKDYDFVNYVNIGTTVDDDFVEDYKTSDLFNKLTNYWENKTSFADRMRMMLDKVIAPRSRENFVKQGNRKVILEKLQISDSYKINFDIQCYGVFYPYEMVYLADRDDSGILNGVICCVRISDSVDDIMRRRNDLEAAQKGIDREKAFNSLFIDNYEAAYLVNLRDHSFESYKRSSNVSKRNSLNPDFEIYFHGYVNRDVYFEDRQMMIEASTISNIRSRLQRNASYAINFRDVAKGQPLYYKMSVLRAGKDFAAIGFTYINEEVMKENADKERLEYLVRQQTSELEDKNRTLQGVNNGIIELIGDIVELRRENSAQHTHKIRKLTYILSCQLMNDYPELDLTHEQVLAISEASILHDVGKIAIPDEILFKPGELTYDEFEIMKTHSEKGVKLINKLKRFWTDEYYKLVYEICLYHHERWNGEGYPKGLKGNDIPLHAQIVSVTDAFDALVSERVYKGPYEPDVARQMIIDGECGSFNPKIISAFKNCYARLKDCIENDNEMLVESKPEEEDAFYKNIKDVAFINENTLPIVAHMSEHMPGGFFIYKNDENRTLLFFNNLMVKYFKCEDRQDFIKYVNNSFRGIVHPDDYQAIDSAINQQVASSEENLDHIKYRIICKDGEERVIDDYGRLVHSDTYGDIFYVFILDITDQEKHARSITSSSIHSENVKLIDRSSEAVSSVTGTRALEDVRILLVDDNDLSRLMTKETLEEEGAHVSDFGSGQSALEVVYKVKPFDLILVDLVMPDMNGVEVTRAIREWEKDQEVHVPIVAVTGEQTGILAKQCIEVGATGCMGKPLVISELSRLLILSMKEHFSRMENKLSETIRIANTDPLTLVKNATAYHEKINALNHDLRHNPDIEFGIIIADINRLKYENDNYGHDIGDIYIKNCAKLICGVFVHSPVYRIGGDEFAVILQEEDLAKNKDLFNLFEKSIKVSEQIEASEQGKASIAAGLAVYKKGIDFTVEDVIKRADEEMYQNKRKYKIEHNTLEKD